MIWNEVNLISIVYIAIWFLRKIMWCCCWLAGIQARDETSTTHQLSRTHHAFKPSRYHKISSIGLASMQKILQLYFSILSQTECGCAWCNHDRIATATDWFCESRHKKVWLRFVAEVLRWATECGQKTGEIWVIKPSSQSELFLFYNFYILAFQVALVFRFSLLRSTCDDIPIHIRRQTHKEFLATIDPITLRLEFEM